MTTINFGFEDAPATFMINRTGVYRLASRVSDPHLQASRRKPAEQPARVQ